jgi:hypothetical protein
MEDLSKKELEMLEAIQKESVDIIAQQSALEEKRVFKKTTFNLDTEHIGSIVEFNGKSESSGIFNKLTREFKSKKN